MAKMSKSMGSKNSVTIKDGSPISTRPKSGMALNTSGAPIGQGYNQYPSEKGAY